MSGQRALDPDEIPKFTGDQEQLDKDVSNIGTDATSLWDAGAQIDTTFNSLSAYYTAPDADKLFATTRPVATAGSDLCDELETVAGALAAYADEVRPLVKTFERLRQEASDFQAAIAHDDDWREDGDKVEENNHRRSEVNAAWAAFQAAERDCYAKIVKLVGGDPLKVDDGSGKKGMYGYRAEDLDHTQGLPWGDPVDESTPWYRLDEHAWNFAKGFFVDGVWGTIRGLGTLVGVDGWDAAGQAWKGLGQLLTGVALTVVAPAAYWTASDDELPSWLRDSRRAVKETAKALTAWDEWDKNPSRAAGAVTFNVLTTVFTGGAGTAAKTGGIAKAISLAGKAGRVVDPLTYVAKAAGFGLTRVGDVMASLKAVTKGTYVELAGRTYEIADQPLAATDLPAGLTPENSVRLETPKGEVVYLDTKTMTLHNADGTVRESLENVAREGSAEERAAAAHHEAPGRSERELAGARAGGHGDAAGHAAGGAGDGVPGGGADALPPHSHGPDRPGDLDRLGGSEGDRLDGGHPNGADPREIMRRHVELANTDKAWFKEHYRSNGYRRYAIREVFGQRLPTLVRDPADPGRWIAKNDLPPATPAKYLDPNPHPRGSAVNLPKNVLHKLDEWAHTRHEAIAADKAAETALSDAEKAYADHPTPELEAARDAAEAAHSPVHGEMAKQSELFGENVAEYHAIPDRYPNAKRVDDGAFGNNRFDQIYRNPDGGFVVVEAKGSLKAQLGERTSHLGNRVQQGTREYFETILQEMQHRAKRAKDPAEKALAKNLRIALLEGKVDYVLVKADATPAGKYAGYEMKQFDISEPGIH
ncbi:hypothetical protein ACFSL4_14680 [Streptomyces caeni]|uniref:Tox-REase-7 domain-containing protein n=1 Tax=Streptomyces caeni TaxID=2307231 RepID=A0ABW4IR84_9ACTN